MGETKETAFYQLHPGVWVVKKPFSMFRQNIGSRMTIVRLESGELWLHSPVELTDDEHRELIEMGPPGQIVAPNLMHHLFLGEFVRRYPKARVYGPPGLESKVPEIEFQALDSSSLPPWGDELAFLLTEGMPEVREIAFLHRASRTLIIADLALHIHEVSGPVGKALAWLNQSYKNFGPSRVCKLYIRDHAVLGRSIAKLLEWDFDRVVVSHGEIVEAGGKEKLRDAYQWLYGRVPLTDRILKSLPVWAKLRRD